MERFLCNFMLRACSQPNHPNDLTCRNCLNRYPELRKYDLDPKTREGTGVDPKFPIPWLLYAFYKTLPEEIKTQLYHEIETLTLSENPAEAREQFRTFYTQSNLPLQGLILGIMNDTITSETLQTEDILAAGDELRTSGYHEAAISLYEGIPLLIQGSSSRELNLVGQSLQNKARALEALNRLDRADSNFALARHIFTTLR
jgi:hypothetical protein